MTNPIDLDRLAAAHAAAPKRIYLLDYGSIECTWCIDPSPSGEDHQPIAYDRADAIEAELRQLRDERDALREALIDAGASLAAAISLLERGGKAAKKAAPSDKMFNQMVKDYKASLDRARAALESKHG